MVQTADKVTLWHINGEMLLSTKVLGLFDFNDTFLISSLQQRHRIGPTGLHVRDYSPAEESEIQMETPAKKRKVLIVLD
jgi:hypothetical protein